MSMETWHDYGQGISLTDLETDKSRLLDLICLAKDFRSRVEEEYEMTVDEMRSDESVTLCDLKDCIYNLECNDGIGATLVEVIKEIEGVRLECCDDYKGRYYLIFPSRMPWNYVSAERSMTEDSCRKLFERYLCRLTDQSLDDLDYGWKQIENCG